MVQNKSESSGNATKHWRLVHNVKRHTDISCMEYTSKSIFVVGGVQHIPCTTAAVFLYYFGTTGRLWWFVLCCTWNRCTQRSQQNSTFLHDSLILRTHVLAWGVPLGVVMLALIAQSVHADPLSGMCLVGGDSRIIEAVFVSLRELILLLCCLDSLILRTHVLAWGVPLGVVMLALIAQSVHADPLSGMCLVGGDSRIIEAVFVSLRELILLLCCLVPLFFGCLALIGSAPANDHSVASSGLLASLYPMAAAFLLLSSLQYVLSPAVSGWNTVAAVKLLADPLLGILASIGCLFQILYNIFNANRSPLVDKHGYQPAVPHIPQPSVPTTTYSTSSMWLSPAVSGWNTVAAVKLLADPLLGILASIGCLFQILYNIFNANRSPLVDKHGYQPAVPHIPQPSVPTTTYSTSRYPEQRPLC
uniref:Frizzled-4 n=1 Tax=Ascaris lumbricoides TaxID=6252 RepID=A0A0M3I4Y1_ASCLU